MYRINFIFSKKGPMRFISHLDLMRLLIRAMRRADLPLKISQGFSPRPKLSMKRALKLGLESDQEEAAVALNEPVAAGDFMVRLKQQLPEGIEIRDAQGNFT